MPKHDWEKLMFLALETATQAVYKMPAEVPVGAVIVAKNGEVLATAHNMPISLNDPTAHAEILALRQAGQILQNYRLNEAVMVVSLEPCLMCVGAILQARLAGLVYGAYDKKAGAVSSVLHGLDLPTNSHKLWHIGGVLADDCTKLLDDFFKKLR